MYREIKFRGKKKGTNEWLYFDLMAHILNEDGEPCDFLQYNIEADTVGQFTGLTDKNGKEIYDGDICKHPDAVEPEHLGFEMVFEDFKFKAICVFHDDYIPERIVTDFSEYFNETEIIGNIHENPELLNR